MTFKQVRDALSAPLEWVAGQIKARPKGALIVGAVVVVVAIGLAVRWL